MGLDKDRGCYRCAVGTGIGMDSPRGMSLDRSRSRRRDRGRDMGGAEALVGAEA